MKKRVIAAMLACVMSMGLFAGCGSTSGNSNNDVAATEGSSDGN